MLSHPVLAVLGLVAAVTFFGGVRAASDIVDNSAWTGGASIGVILGGLPDLVDGFNDGRQAAEPRNPNRGEKNRNQRPTQHRD